MKTRTHTVLVLLALLAVWGCGGSAEIERKQAQSAMDEAMRLQSDRFATADFEQARKAWEHALAAEKDGQTGKAKVLFSSAKIYAGKAADIAKAKQDALSRELNSIQLLIDQGFDQVKNDLAASNLSRAQQSRVKAMASEIEAGKASISDLVRQNELVKAVASAKDIQTKIYHAQLILAGQKIK